MARIAVVACIVLAHLLVVGAANPALALRRQEPSTSTTYVRDTPEGQVTGDGSAEVLGPPLRVEGRDGLAGRERTAVLGTQVEPPADGALARTGGGAGAPLGGQLGLASGLLVVGAALCLVAARTRASAAEARTSIELRWIERPPTGPPPSGLVIRFLGVGR